MDFERWFQERTSHFEKWVIKGVALLLFLLLVSQALLTQPGIRGMLSLVDRLEGTPVANNDPEVPVVTRPQVTQVGYVELSITNNVDAKDVKVKVNGDTVATFGSQRTIRVAVHDGDAVEIDGTISQKNVEIEVTAVSSGIISPLQGKKVTYFGQPETVSFISMEAE